MSPRLAIRTALFVATTAGFLATARPAGAEHCWEYVDGFNPATGQVNFPGKPFSRNPYAKVPITCVDQGDQQSACYWLRNYSNGSQMCHLDGDPSDCCTSVVNTGAQDTIRKMHEDWHKCFGNFGGQTPNPGRSARWLAFHRQFEFDFDLFREENQACGPGRCLPGICTGGASGTCCSNDSGRTCANNVDCNTRDGCFIESLDWYQGMTFPHGHPGVGLSLGQYPAGCDNNFVPCCGMGVARPADIVCTTCLALPRCLYNPGTGPISGPETPSDSFNCFNFETLRLNQIPTLEDVAKILDLSHHGAFHAEVEIPFTTSCTTDADCAQHPGQPTCDTNFGACIYSHDVGNSSCSPRDPMFWRLHKRLDDTVRAWQETHPIDLTVVIDRSGSMSETDSSTPTRKKIQVATEAMRMLVDLLPSAGTSRVSVVSYSTNVVPNLPITSVANAKAGIAGVATAIEAGVGGCTSIGSGLEAAVAQMCNGVSTNALSVGKKSCNPSHRQVAAANENERKGILLLTDGLENRQPCLKKNGAETSVCGDTCGGGQFGQFDYDLLSQNTQLCAVGFGQAQSINGNLLTLLAERQGGIYMQSPAKGPNDLDGGTAQGEFVDLKDFFVKCLGQLSNEFIGVDPKGTLSSQDYATEIVPYSTCDDERMTFVAGWNKPSDGAIRLMVNAPSGALVRPGAPVESSLQEKWNFFRVPLPHNGESAGTWNSQIIRPHNDYVNGFTTDSLPVNVAVPLVRKQIQRICPDGCANVLYFEQGLAAGSQSSYDLALTAEEQSGLLASVTRAVDADDFNAQLLAADWNLIVYAHQQGDDALPAEPYDVKLREKICFGTPAIVTETRGLDQLSSTPGPNDPNYNVFYINACAGGTPFGTVNFTQLVGDGRLLTGTHALTNHGYTRFSYGQFPLQIGGPTQAVATTPTGATVAAISAFVFSYCDGESCANLPVQNWFIDVMVRGKSQLDDAPTRFTYRTGESGMMASARVLPANIPLGGYDQADVTVEVQRPTVGVGQTLLNVGQQPSGGTATADGPDGRAAALGATKPIATVTQTYTLNDDGTDPDLVAKNGQWTAHIPDSDTPGQCLVDGMYRLHFKANFTKNGCTTRRELVRSTFVDVGVDPGASNMTITPRTDGMQVEICPKDRCGNPAGWGRHISCGPTPGCTCAPSDIIDRGNGCYGITIHTTPSTATCTIDGTGKPIDVKVPVTANAGPDQLLECSGGGGATAQLDGSASRDASGATLTYLWSAPGITFSNATIANPTARFPLGTTTVTLQVTSSNGTSTDTMQVTVLDTTPPVLVVPADVTISSCNAPNIGTAIATDGCGGSVTLINNKPAKFPLGTTVVTYTAVDRFGNAVARTQRVTAILADDTSCCPAGTKIIKGTPNNDTLNGTSGSDCILGLGAQDRLNGSGGNDFISGGEGDDIIDGGSGNDQMWGGNGQDQLTGGTGNDLLEGGGGDDTCRGGDNDDIIRGGQGQDKLFGDNGNDQLFGETGDDRLEGGAGNDHLDGGGIHDVCVGGTGSNTFNLCETRL